MSYSDEQDRIMETLLAEVHGGERPPDVAERVLARAFPPAPDAEAANCGMARGQARWYMPRLARWAAALAAVVVLALGVGLYLRSRRPVVTAAAYPQPVATGAFTVVGGGAVRRGAELATQDQAAALTLGGYCELSLAPQTRLSIAGGERSEAVVLRQGDVTCEVDRGVGGFEVRTQVGRVRVQGTRFRVSLEDSPAPFTLDLGDDSMVQRKMIVAVFSGLVVVSCSWGEASLTGGESMVFSAAPSAAGGRAAAPATDQAEPTFKGDHPLISALSSAQLTGEQKTKLLPVMDAAAKGFQELQDWRRGGAALIKELNDACAAAEKAGGRRASRNDPKCQELGQKVAKFTTDRQKEFETRRAELRDKTIAQILPLVTEEQGRIIKLRLKQRAAFFDNAGTGGDASPDRFAADLEEEFLLSFAPGCNLTEEQHQKAIEALRPLVEQYKKGIKAQGNLTDQLPGDLRNDPGSPAAQKAIVVLAGKAHAQRKPMMKAMREAVEAVLTPEQRQAVAESRRKTSAAWGDTAVAEIQKAGLTEQQKQKAKELIETARQEVLKLDPEDQGGAPGQSLYRKLREDLRSLLTEQQKKILDPPITPGDTGARGL